MYPDNDGLKMGVTIELPPATTLEKSQQVADRVGEIIRSKPYIESSVKLVGRKSPMAVTSLADALRPTEGEYFVGFSAVFVDRAEREQASFVYTDHLRAEIEQLLQSQYAAARVSVVGESGGPSTVQPIEIALSGDDIDKLIEISEQVQNALAELEGVVEIRDNVGAMQAEIALRPDREAIDFYGITQRDLASQIRYAMSNDTIGSFAVSGVKDDLDIRLGMDWPSRKGEGGGPRELQELSLVRAFTPEGTM